MAFLHVPYSTCFSLNSDVVELLQNKKRVKTQWILHNLSSNAAPLVSVLFWTIAYDGE